MLGTLTALLLITNVIVDMQVNSSKTKVKLEPDCPTSCHSNVDKKYSLNFGQHQPQVTIS